MKKLRRLSVIADERGAGAVCALLILDLIVGGFFVAAELPNDFGSKARAPGAAEEVSLAVSIDPSTGLRADGVSLSKRRNLPVAEFAAALRAGDVDFGTWAHESQTFLVDTSDLNGASLREHRSIASGNGG